MAEVVIVDEIAASTAKVWDVIGDFAGLAKWAAVESCSVEGDGVGAIRTLGMPGGIQIAERLESFDAEKHHFSYSMTDTGPLPMSDYVASVKLSELGPDRCGIEWSGRFEPVGTSVEQAEKMVQGIYTGGIAAIKKLVEA